VYYCLLQ